MITKQSIYYFISNSMSRNFTVFLICIFFLFQCASIPLKNNSENLFQINDGQTYGAIRGKVFDHKTIKPLPGTNIILRNTEFGIATDKDGLYLINRIPPGIYVVEAWMIGYGTVTTRLFIPPQQVIEVNFELYFVPVEGIPSTINSNKEGT